MNNVVDLFLESVDMNNNPETDNEWINNNQKLAYAFRLYKDSAEDEQARLKADLIMVNAENRWLRQVSMALTATSIVLFGIVWFTL